MLVLTACSKNTDSMIDIDKNDIAPIVMDDKEEKSKDKTILVTDFSL